MRVPTLDLIDRPIVPMLVLVFAVAVVMSWLHSAELVGAAVDDLERATIAAR